MIDLKQPKGLYLLFCTEMWERFGFYTVQVLLVLFLVKRMGFSDEKAYMLFATFSALLYLMPVIGGYLADHFLGFQRSVIGGAAFFILGYFLTSFEDYGVFLMGLSFIIVANGLFKPSISSMVGSLYEKDDARRDGGFTIFYMGINIGSLIPPLIMGTVVAYLGWQMGFLFASCGLVIGLSIFLIGRKRLGAHGSRPDHSPLRGSPSRRWMNYLGLYACLIGLVILFHAIFYFPVATDSVLLILIVPFLVFTLYRICKEQRFDRNRMFAALILIALSIGFWAIYNQMFTSLILFADRNVKLGIFDAEFVPFLNPAFILILSPFLAKFWAWVRLKTPLQFAIALVFTALAYFTLSWSLHLGDRVSMVWVALALLFQTLGELFLSPIGLAMITRLSTRANVGLMMGMWFTTQSVAAVIGGKLATFTDVHSYTSKVASAQIYERGFFIFGCFALVLAALGFLLVPFLNRLISCDQKGR